MCEETARRGKGARRRRTGVARGPDKPQAECGGAAGRGPAARTSDAATLAGAFVAVVVAVAVAGAVTAGGLDAGSRDVEIARFAIGEAIFDARWRPAPDVSQGIDGLGPLYNAESCAGCHGGNEEPRVQRVVRLARGDGSPDPVYGLQVQDRAIAGHAAEGRIVVQNYGVDIDPGGRRSVQLKRPLATVADLAFGPLDTDTRLSLRVPPPIDGIGLLASIDDDQIRAAADPDDADGDGISGRVGLANDADGKPQLARFGWKASAATLAQQTAEALQLDMGIGSPAIPRPAGDCTAAQTRCLAAPHGDRPTGDGREISEREIELLVAYLKGLAPPQSSPDLDTGKQGEAVFYRSGCASCHRPSFTVAAADAQLGSARRVVPLYSDLLLHDMGDGLADGVPQGVATPSEWRTPPLWGLRQRIAEIARAARTGLLHDGRAASVEHAVLWHGGEASKARSAFAGLPEADRAALLTFLSGL